MKITLKIFLFIITFIAKVFSQNYFPLEEGNKYYCWNYKSVNNYGTYTFYDSTTITESIIINGDKYFKIWNYYYSYNQGQKKLFILINGEKKLAVNFNKFTGGDTLYYNGKKLYYDYRGVVEKNINGKLIKCFRIGIETAYTGAYYRIYEFLDGVGEFYYQMHLSQLSGHNLWVYDTTKTTLFIKGNNFELNFLQIPEVSSIKLLHDNYSEIRINDFGCKYEDGFIIERRKKNEPNFVVIGSLQKDVFTFFDNSVQTGNKYIYRIRIKANNLLSEPSIENEFTALQAPLNLMQDTAVISGIKLKWDFNSYLSEKFIVERKEKLLNGQWSEFLAKDTINSAQRFFIDLDFDNSCIYNYRIKTLYQDLQSGYSNEALVFPIVQIAPVYNFAAEYRADEVVEVFWQDTNSLNTITYLERSQPGGTTPWVNLGSSDSINNYYEDIVNISNISYLYRVKTELNKYSKSYSDTLNVFIPTFQQVPMPNNFKAQKLDSTKILLSWEGNAVNATQFVLYKGTNSNIMPQLIVLGKGARSYIDEIENTGSLIEFYYGLKAKNSRYVSPTSLISIMINDLKNEIKTLEYKLKQNYPNPFNPITKICYEVPKNSFVQLKVYDVIGNEIIKLVNEEKPTGKYEIEFDGEGLASGLYFYRIVAGDFVETRKMILMK